MLEKNYRTLCAEEGRVSLWFWFISCFFFFLIVHSLLSLPFIRLIWIALIGFLNVIAVVPEYRWNR